MIFVLLGYNRTVMMSVCKDGLKKLVTANRELEGAVLPECSFRM